LSNLTKEVIFLKKYSVKSKASVEIKIINTFGDISFDAVFKL